MPSRLSRRRFLGGFAGVGAASYSGYRFLPATVLPDPVLGVRIERIDVPAVDTSLAVAPDALASARDHLRDVVDRAESAWANVDDSDVSGETEEFDRSLESTLDGAKKKLSATKDAEPTTEALKELRYGVNRAAWSLAAAKAIAEDYDADSLRERSEALFRDANDFVDATSYDVADPRRGLAYLYRTERVVHFARMSAHGGTYFSGESVGKSEYDHREAVEAIRGAIEGRRWLGDAKAVYDAHRSNLADAGRTTDLRDHLDRTWRGFAERIDGLLPDRETVVERYFTDDEGARNRAANELFNNGYSGADDASPPTRTLRRGLLALAAVEHAKALQHARGFRSAMDALDRAFSGGSVGLARAEQTKRTAVRRLRTRLDESNDPLTRELLARPREEIVIGDWPLGLSPTFDSKYPAAEAYAMYLLASENVRHTADVRRLLLP